MFGLIKSRSARWMLGFAVGFGAVAPWVAAREENIPLDKVPVHVRHEIENGTKGGKHIVVIVVKDEERPIRDFFVRYELEGKDMKMRIAENGKVLEHGETRAQRHKDEEARLAQAKTDEDRAKIQASLAAAREAEDRAAFEAQKAALEQQKAALDAEAARQAAAHSAPAPAGHPAPAPPAAAPPAAAQAQDINSQILALRELSEEWNSKDRRPVSFAELPPKVQVTLGNESKGGTHVDYFAYTVDGKQFYSAHYDTGADRRIICRVQHDGELAGKHELTGAAVEADIKGK